MATSAERVIVEIEARTQGFDASVARSAATHTRAMTEIERAATKAEGSIRSSATGSASSFDTMAGAATRSAGEVKVGFQQLGFQFNDVVAQLAAGANPMTVFAQQASQIFQALQLIGTGGGDGGAKGAGDAVEGLNEKLGSASETYDKASSQAEQLAGVLGTQAAAENASTTATNANTGATARNTAATGADTKATGANAAATTGAAAAKARMAAIMTGPWGAAIIAGITVLGALGATMLKTEESVDKLIKKKREDAAASAVQREADQLYQNSALGRIEAARELAETLRAAGQSESGQRADQLEQLTRGQNMAANLLEMVERYHALLRQVQEDEKLINIARTGLGASEARKEWDELNLTLQRLGLTTEQLQGDQLPGLINTLRELAQAGLEARRALRFENIFDDIEAAGDPAAIERLRYQRQIDSYRETFREGGFGQGAAGEAELQGALERARQQHDQTMRQIEERKEAEQEAERQAENLRRAAERRAQQAVEFVAAMERETAAVMELAAAYLNAGEAAGRFEAETGDPDAASKAAMSRALGLVNAEAEFNATEDAVRHGLDLQAQMRRELALAIAEQVRETTRSTLEMEDEAAALEAISTSLGQTADGWMRLDDVAGKYALLQPLLRMEHVAEGDQLRILTQAIDAAANAYDRLQRARRRGEAMQAIGRVSSEINVEDQLRPFIGDPRRMEIERARLTAREEARQRQWDPALAQQYENLQVDRARQAQDIEARASIAETIQGQQDALRLLEAEQGMLGLNSRERAKQLRILEASLDLHRRFGPEYATQIQQVLDLIAAEEDRRAALESSYQAMAEIQRVGGAVIDEVFDPDNWDDWGEAGQRIIQMLIREFLTLAAINPLKNMLFGSDLPELGGVLGSLGALFGGGAGNTDSIALAAGILGKSGFGGFRASGGPVSAGTAYVVGERGQELFVPNQSGVIVPSAPGRITVPQGGASETTATVRLELTDDLNARIVNTSGAVAVEVVRASTPGIVRSATAETMRQVQRPKLGR